MTAAQILAFRRRRGWTQAQAAEAIGRSPRAWRMYEEGREIPRVVELAIIALEIGATGSKKVSEAVGRLRRAHKASVPHHQHQPIRMLPPL